MVKKAPETLIHGVQPYKLEKGEEYMNQNQLEHFRNILNAWLAELTDETSRTVHHLQDENVNQPDPADRASIETDIALELRERDRDRKLIKKVEQSLSMIDSGDFGYCQSCGVEIGIKRLEARPTAELCIDCKTLDEIRETRMY